MGTDFLSSANAFSSNRAAETAIFCFREGRVSVSIEIPISVVVTWMQFYSRLKLAKAKRGSVLIGMLPSTRGFVCFVFL